MAFCPSCGKVLPPNGVCECGYTAAPAPQNNGQAGAPGAAGAAGSGAFGEAINVFVGAFKNPATNSQGVFTGKISPTAGFILGGLYCLGLWLTLTLMLLGCSMSFVPSMLFGLLGAVVFVIIRFISSILIYALSKNNAVNIPKIFAAQCVDTVIPGCVLLLGALFGFITTYFALFFFIIYFSMILYQQISMLKKLAGNINANMMFIKFSLFVLWLAFIGTICYLIFNQVLIAQVKSFFGF
ncbi:MAG: hypothetical protein IK014_06295 [Lachnospiraceae bacterium]|nr:hypothetical protein [Lachnospiraceae bacterium]